MDELLNSDKVQGLEIAIEEATRSTEEGVKRFIEPAHGTLSRALAKRPHIVFGRRGSGKSSLLRKVASDLTVDRRPIAFVDLESFKGHSYPDVLISILIQTLERFGHWLDTAAVNPANKTTFWKELFGTKPSRSPFSKERCKALSGRLRKEVDDLKRLLLSEDQVATVTRDVDLVTAGESASASANIGIAPAGLSAEAGIDKKKSHETEVSEQFTRVKLDLLHRRIIEYQKIFRDLSSLANGDSYLVLDDLYHIRRSVASH